MPFAEQDERPIKHIQSYWQHCSLTSDSDARSNDRLPASLDIWSLLAATLSKSLPASDEYDDSDAAVMAVLSFTIQVLKFPLEAVKRNAAAVVAAGTLQDKVIADSNMLLCAQIEQHQHPSIQELHGHVRASQAVKMGCSGDVDQAY